MNINKPANLYNSENKRKLYRDFNLKIPISLSNPEKRGRDGDDD
jgi:hypothetical protein